MRGTGRQKTPDPWAKIPHKSGGNIFGSDAKVIHLVQHGGGFGGAML